MNINKKLVKGTVITAAAVTMIATTGLHMVHAADINNLGIMPANIIQVADNQTTTVASTEADNTAYKDETVYVIADATGNTQKIIVSDWLKNANASAGLTDYTTLSNLMNVKGNETFESSDNSKLTWDAQGNDIYYQGTSEADLPVNVKVTYSLDGVEMAPEDMVGKSGKITVRYDYTNLLKQTADINGTNEDIFTPILMITGAILPTDHYTNVEVVNGKIISDGNNQMVVGISLPGMTDSLKADSDKLTIPEYFEYTADVIDYSIGTSASLGLTDVLSDVNINGEDFRLDDIQGKVDELVDGVDQLLDGSSQLYDGTNDLCDGTNALFDGSNQLYDGLNTLLSKTGDYKDAVKTLSSNLSSLKDALSKLESGAKSFDDGADSLVNGAASLKDGIRSAKDGMDKIVGGYSSVESGVSQLSSGIDSLATGADTLKTGIDSANDSYATLSGTVSNDEAIIAALKQVNEGYKDETIAALITKLEQNTAGQKQIADGLANAGSQLSAGASNLSLGASQLKSGVAGLSSGVKSLSDGSVTVQSGLSDLYIGSDKLYTGAQTLAAGTESLVSNTKELSVAGEKLATGGTSLLTATNQLFDGINQLKTGSNDLVNGIDDLKDGAITLKDGAGDLKDGIQTLKDDGISQITDFVSGDLQNIIERFKAAVDQGKSYNNYSGIGDNMDGNVKFIIKYEDSKEK